jgi:oxygen-independent coproporphyrinogen III oxidase
MDNFVEYLIKEIGLFTEGKRLKVDSIYLGGGTPSILKKTHLEKIFNSLYDKFIISEKCEISAECNPEDIVGRKNKLVDLRDTGINRISLGVQSFIDNELTFLSRQHDSKQAFESVMDTREIFRNYSIDMIYDLPGQEISSIECNLSRIAELNVPHVSAYTLITEKGTLLHKRLLDTGSINEKLSNEKLYSFFNENMKQLGYSHYEISNYSKNGFESLHNLKYWLFEEYVGFGPSSHSFYEKIRWNNFPDIRKYSKSLNSGKLPKENVEILTKQKLEEDYFICTLRSKGVDKVQYRKLFSKDFDDSYSKIIEKLTDLGLGINISGFFSLTEMGYSVADEISLEFIRSIKS